MGYDQCGSRCLYWFPLLWQKYYGCEGHYVPLAFPTTRRTIRMRAWIWDPFYHGILTSATQISRPIWKFPQTRVVLQEGRPSWYFSWVGEETRSICFSCFFCRHPLFVPYDQYPFSLSDRSNEFDDGQTAELVFFSLPMFSQVQILTGSFFTCAKSMWKLLCGELWVQIDSFKTPESKCFSDKHTTGSLAT